MMAVDPRETAGASVRRIEPLLVLVVFFVVVALLSVFYLRTTTVRNLDSVFLFESVQSIADGEGPVSRTVATWPEALRLFTVPAGEICASPLGASGQEQYNVLNNHAYMALFPLALVSAALGPEATLGITNALAHVLLLLLPYLFLRRRGARVFPAAGFSVCVALYVGWSYSAAGEYYLDRLYMPLALGACYLGHRVFAEGKDQPRLVAYFLLCALGAALFTERAAMMMAGLLAFFVVVHQHPRANGRTTMVVAAAAVVLAIYVLAYHKWMHVGIAHGGNAFVYAGKTLLSPLPRLQDPKFVPFILVNLPLAALVMFAGWRYVLLVAGSMLPNVLVTTGGAELNGWATHYHAMYIPFLVFGASVGFARIASSLSLRGQHAFGVVAILASAVWATTLDPVAGSFASPNTSTINQGGIGRLHAYFLRPSQSHERMLSQAFSKLDEMVPEGASVATMERAMPALYAGRHVYYYPLGLDDVDYVVIPGAVEDGAATGLTGAVSYLGPEEALALNSCLAERLMASGFVLADHVPAIGVVVLRRKQAGL
jgi:hypothetical protein